MGFILLFGVFQLHQIGKFIRNITLNMVRFHYHFSHVSSSLSSPSIDHDKDTENLDDQVLPPLIRVFQEEVADTPSLIIFSITFPSAMPNPLDPAKVVFLPHHGERDSPSTVFFF